MLCFQCKENSHFREPTGMEINGVWLLQLQHTKYFGSSQKLEASRGKWNELLGSGGASFSPPESPNHPCSVFEVKKIVTVHRRIWWALVEEPFSFALGLLLGQPLATEYLCEVMKEFARCGRHPGISGDGGSFVAEMCLVP